MNIGHDPIAIANFRECAAAFCAAVDGDEFPDGVFAADAGFGIFASILFVLRGHAYGRVRIEEIVFANPSRAFNI